MILNYESRYSKQAKGKSFRRYPKSPKIVAWVPVSVPSHPLGMRDLDLFQFEDWTLPSSDPDESVEYREFSSGYLPSSQDSAGRCKNSWLLDTGRILDALENHPSLKRKESAAIAASVTTFTSDQKPRLLKALEKYIESGLQACDEDSLTAVGAAARKFGMNMEPDGFDSFRQWFSQSDGINIHPDLLMELAKGVRWRFVFLPFAEQEKYPLVEALKKTVSQFSQSHSVEEKNYAAVRLELYLALIEVAAMQDELDLIAGDLNTLEHVNEEWFVDMLRKSLFDDVKRMEARGNAAIADRIRKILKRSD